MKARGGYAARFPMRETLPLAPVRLLAALLLLALLACGCDEARDGLAALTSRSEPFEEIVGDPVALATVRTVVVLPFADHAPQRGFDAMTFSTRLASQLALTGKLRVIYPAEAMALVERERLAILRHNAEYRRRQSLGIPIAAERGAQLERARGRGEDAVAGLEDELRLPPDPVNNIEDAVTLGRVLKADAVLMGDITDFDPYMRPRIALSTTLVTTGTSDAAALALAELTQWGVPRRASTAFGRAWFYQQNFDSRVGNISVGAYLHGVSHNTRHDPYDTALYLRSVTNYYDYVGNVLAAQLLHARAKAVEEAEERARARARELRMTQEAARQQIRALVEPGGPLPDPDAALQANLGERRDLGWRPDVYNQRRPDKTATLHPAYRPMDCVPPGPGAPTAPVTTEAAP